MDNADNDEAGQARLLAAGAPLQVTIDAPAVSPDAVVAELVVVAADAHHRLRATALRVLRATRACFSAVLYYGEPDVVRLESGVHQIHLDLHRIRGPV